MSNIIYVVENLWHQHQVTREQKELFKSSYKRHYIRVQDEDEVRSWSGYIIGDLITNDIRLEADKIIRQEIIPQYTLRFVENAGKLSFVGVTSRVVYSDKTGVIRALVKDKYLYHISNGICYEILEGFVD